MVDATRIALKYRTPVLLLSDGAIANGSEPWLIPDVDDAARPDGRVRDRTDARTSSRTPVIPRRWPARGRYPALLVCSTASAVWRRQDSTGNISYDPDNHDRMVRLRQAKIDGIEVPDVVVDDPTGDAKVLVVGWGSSYGPIGAAARRVRKLGPAGRARAPAAPQPVPQEPG